MANKATTVDQQIELLKSRGMIILHEDHEKAKEYLLDIGYYRLGFYWYYFELDKQHNFKEGTSLNDALVLYYFDVVLRNLLAKYLYRIEVHFRTQVVYIISNHYRDSPTWFIDSKVVNSYFLDKKNTIYNDNFKINNVPIKNHHKKYINDKYAPAWKALEFFTFGQVFTLYRNLKDIDLKKAVASIYGVRDVYVFENHISAIINIRNICSHSGVLFDFNQPKGIKKIPSNQYKLKTRNQTNINASIRLILYVLSNVSKNRATDLEISIKEFMGKYQRYPALQKIFNDHICFDM